MVTHDMPEWLVLFVVPLSAGQGYMSITVQVVALQATLIRYSDTLLEQWGSFMDHSFPVSELKMSSDKGCQHEAAQALQMHMPCFGGYQRVVIGARPTPGWVIVDRQGLSSSITLKYSIVSQRTCLIT